MKPQSPAPPPRAPLSEAPTHFAAVPEWHARHRREAVAVDFNGARQTWREFAGRCDRIAHRLAEDWKVGAGDRIAWLGLNHPDQLALLFALARIGGILVPLNTRLATGEWSQLLADARPMRLVHDITFAAAAEALAHEMGVAASPVESLIDGDADRGDGIDVVGDGCRLSDGRYPTRSNPSLDASKEPRVSTASGDPHPMPRDFDATAPLLLVYTSGTTGQPRGALHTAANLLAGMRIASKAQAMTVRDVVLTVLPLFHVGGLCIQTLPALFVGARVLLHPRFAAGAAIDAIAHQRPTLTLQVPATMQALAAHPAWPHTDLSCLRAAWAGSSVLPRAAIDAFHARGVPVCNVYGSTETGPFSIALPPERAVSHAGSCGWSAEEVEVRLVGIGAAARSEMRSSTLHSVIDEGEIWIRAPNVARHYWPHEPSVDDEGWFHTGDLARRAADGAFTVVGRSKELIISGGENIHPAEIDEALASHPAVLECAAFGLVDAQWGEVVAVAIVRREGQAITEAELIAYLSPRLARFKQPRRWIFVDALPKTALGKMRRGALAGLIGDADADANPLTSSPSGRGRG